MQLRKEGVAPEEGSPEARAEMLNILEELGFDSEASVTGSDEPSWWQKEEAAREEAASSSAAASAEAAAQQRQDQRQMQAEADAEGATPLRSLAGASSKLSGHTGNVTKSGLRCGVLVGSCQRKAPAQHCQDQRQI